MNAAKLLFGERYLHKVAATFGTASAAQDAAEHLVHDAHLTGKQVQVVAPDDPEWGRRLEPEGVGITHTFLRTHTTLGLLGMMAGVAMYLLLRAIGNPAIESAPVGGFLVLAAFGAVIGLLAGGLATLRPDHEAVIEPVREARRLGRWAVVVHAATLDEERAAIRVLGEGHRLVASSL